MVAVLRQIAEPFDQEDEAQQHHKKPEPLTGPNAYACGPGKGFAFIVMGHESCPATHFPKDRHPGQDDKTDHGEQTPGARDPEPESLIGPGEHRPDKQPDRDQRRHGGAAGTDALLQLALIVRMLEVCAQGMDRSHAFDIDDAEVHGTLSTHFENPRMFSCVVDAVFRGQCHVIPRRAGRRRLLPIARCATGHMIHRPEHGKVGGCLIAAPERRNIALETAVQLQAEGRSDDHIPGPLVLACVKVACVEIDGKEDGVREGRSERFENEHRVVGVRAQDADCFSSFSFVLNPRGQGAHIIKLAGAFGTFLQPTGQHILRCHIGFGFLATPSFHAVVSRYFAIETAEVAIPEDVQGQGLIVRRTLNLQVDRARDGGTPGLDRRRYLNLLQRGLREGRHFCTSRRAELDGQRSTIEGIPLPDEDHRIPAEPHLATL